jgi:hypothetical protein
MSGKPSVRFDGTDDRLDNTANLSNFITAAAFMGILVLRVADIDSGSDDASSPLNNDGVFVDITNSALGISVRKTGPLCEVWSANGGGSPVMSGTPSFSLGSTFLLSFYRSGGVNYVAVNGGSYVGTTQADASPLTGDMRIGASSIPFDFLNGDIGDIWLYNSVDLTTLAGDVSTLLQFYGLSTPGIEQPREGASRLLRLLRIPIAQVDEELPLLAMDTPLLDPIGIIAREAPDVSGLGWQRAPEKRALAVPVAYAPDYEGLSVRVRYLLLDDVVATHWDTMISDLSPTKTRDGVASYSVGGRTFARTTKAYVEDAAATLQGARALAELQTDQEKLTPLGTLFESSRTNSLQRSSMVNGTTGITLTGTGVNASAITADTSRLLFASGVSGNSLKFLAGTTHTTDLVATWPATASITSGTDVCFSCWVETSNAEPLKWRLQRGVDSWYWNDSSAAWQSGAVDNDLTQLGSTTGLPVWNWSKTVPVGGSNTTLTLSMRLPSGGTGSRVSYVYHVQIEAGRYATSPIVTTTATVTRDADVLKITNDHARRSWPEESGHGRAQFLSLYSTADMATGQEAVLLDNAVDASNYFRLFYSKSSAAYIFRCRVGGVNYDASVSGTLSRLGVENVAWRWTGPRGELGLAPYTLDVFRNGVKGTSATPGAGLGSLLASMFLRIGHRDNAGTPADFLDGHLRYLTLSPKVVPDDKMAEI